MIISTQDTNYSTEGILINTSYFIGVIIVLSVKYHTFNEVIRAMRANYHPSDEAISVPSVNYHPSNGILNVIVIITPIK